MNSKFLKIAKACLKIFTAISGGIAAFLGISKLLDIRKPKKVKKSEDINENEEIEYNEEVEINQEDNSNIPEQPVNKEPLSNKLIKGIQLGQTVLTGTVGIIQGINSVTTSINKVFDPNYYNTNVGNSWKQDSGLPYDTPVFRGKDNTGDDIYWVRRGNNTIEVW